MVNSLVAGLSGLRVHQQLIDVVGNNLANSNTPGYKSSRATFAEILTAQLRSASAPTSNVGGTNPQQVGLGVRLGTVDTNMGQGSFQTTGRTFDLAIQGNGFFVVNNGTQNFYTRAGTFGLDSNSDLVDLKNGYKVQALAGGNININTTQPVDAKATAEIEMKGNLPAKPKGPKAQVLESTTAFAHGTAAVLTGGSASTTTDFNITQDATMTIALNGGAPVTITFDTSYGATTTGAAVATEINNDLAAASVTGLTASFSGGKIILTTTLTGSNASILVTDGASGPAAALSLGTSLVPGDQSAATGATDLNEFTDNTTDYVDGDTIKISGTHKDGSPFSDTFVYGASNDGTDVDDLIAFLNSSTCFNSADDTDGSTASIDAAGFLVVTDNEKGESNSSLVITDGDANTGETAWAAHSMQIEIAGTDQDQFVTSIPVYDGQGVAHNLTITFSRSLASNSSWDLEATFDNNDSEAIVTDGSITGISFDANGKLSGDLNGSISVTFHEGDTTQEDNSINLIFGAADEDGNIVGMTQFGETNTVQAALQDGYSEGALSTISIRTDGIIQGVYTNGQVRELGSMGIATFQNPQGLQRVADTLFALSTNSGNPNTTLGATGTAGAVQSGILENSNVDVAEEFVKLVEAQRGFQAAAKVIQTTDQMLGDLNSLR